jgi:hypothetical protein
MRSKKRVSGVKEKECDGKRIMILKKPFNNKA